MKRHEAQRAIHKQYNRWGMMNEIIRQLTEPKKLTKSQVSMHHSAFWAKRVEPRRVQKALLEATKESNESQEFNAIK